MITPRSISKRRAVWAFTLSGAALALACSSTDTPSPDSEGGATSSAGTSGATPSAGNGAGGSSPGGVSESGGSGGTSGPITAGRSGSSAAGGSGGGAPASGGTAGVSTADGGSAGSAGTATGGVSVGGVAGSAGAAGAGGAMPPTPSATCPAGALMCEGFESFATGGPLTGRFVSRSNAGAKATVTVDTLQAHSGTKAVHFYSPSTDKTQKTYVFTKDAPFPVMADQLYVRFMMYVKRFTSAPDTAAHTRIAWVGPANVLLSGGNGAGYAMATYNGLAIERILDPNKGWQRDTTQKMDEASRQGRWQCFEFELDNKGGVPNGEKAGSVMKPHLWQEGKELNLQPGGTADVWAAVRFEALQFSLWSQQEDPMPTEYWIDDIVVSPQRINCPG